MATQNMVSAPERSNSFSNPSNGDGPTGGTSIKGFGGSKPDGSTINAVGGKLAKADKTPGKAVTGFSGNGLIAGKI